MAMLKGVEDREIDSLRATRIVATLLRNAHFKGSISEKEFMPLPGDDEQSAQKAMGALPEATFAALAAAMGATVIIEENGS